MSRLSGQSDGKRLLLKERKLNTSITVQDSSYPVVIAVHFKQNENSGGGEGGEETPLLSFRAALECVTKVKAWKVMLGRNLRTSRENQEDGVWGGERQKKKQTKNNQKTTKNKNQS